MAATLVDGWALQGGLYRDRALLGAGVRHGVTTRSLGDMKDAQKRPAALAAGSVLVQAVTVRQVHGNAVVRADAPIPEGHPADGLVTNTAGTALAVWVADCLPVFLWDPGSRALGLAHAGWRGVRAGIVPATVGALHEHYGCEPSRLLAAIGPHVRSCCYLVSPETARQFPSAAVIERENGTYLDLSEAVLIQLEENGVPRASVSVCARCTASNPEEFFSFRRDKSDARMMAFAAYPGATA